MTFTLQEFLIYTDVKTRRFFNITISYEKYAILILQCLSAGIYGNKPSSSRQVSYITEIEPIRESANLFR